MPATMVRGCGFADIDLHVQQLVGALHALGVSTRPTRRSTLRKSSIAMLVVGLRRLRGRSARLAEQRRLLAR